MRKVLLFLSIILGLSALGSLMNLQGFVDFLFVLILAGLSVILFSKYRKMPKKVSSKQDASPKVSFEIVYTDYLNRCSELPEDYVIIDFETTGLDPNKDRIIEIGIMDILNGEIVDRYEQLVNPGIKIPKEASRVNGITDDIVKGMPKMRDVIQDISEKLKDKVIVGYNVEFDIDFLRKEFSRHGLSLGQIRAMDVLRLARGVIPKEKVKNYKLDTIKKYYKIKNDGHRALADCEATLFILKECGKVQQNWEAQYAAQQAERQAKIGEAEKVFIEHLKDQLKSIRLEDDLEYNILSDKTINFTIKGMQIGRVKLAGRKKSIQVLSSNIDDVSWQEIDGLDQALNKLPLWLKYTKEIAG